MSADTGRPARLFSRPVQLPVPSFESTVAHYNYDPLRVLVTYTSYG